MQKPNFPRSFLIISMAVFLSACTLKTDPSQNYDLLETPTTEHAVKKEPIAVFIAPALRKKPPQFKKEKGCAKLAPASPLNAHPAVLTKQNILQKGDRVAISVYREKDLTGHYQVDDKGMIVFPLVGSVQAANLTTRALEEKLKSALSKGYLVKPDVNVERLPDCTPHA